MTSRFGRMPLASVLFLAAAAAAAADAPPKRPPPRVVFESQLDLVYVTVTVTDPAGKPVADLPDSAFEVREDGRPRPISVFSPGGDEGDSLDVALLLDTSGSMDAELQNAQRAALAVLEKVPRLRRRIVMSFDTDIRIWRPEVEPATLLADIIAARPLNGASVIRSAVKKGIEELTDEGTPRGVLILLSDGVDFGSPVTETQLFRTIESANVGIYPIPFVASQFAGAPTSVRIGPFARSGGTYAPAPHAPDNLAARSFLTHLADASGGLVLTSAGHGLSGALDRMLEELASQYVLGFSPASAAPGRSHRLEVRVNDRRLKVRHRERYLSP
jgi:VWFA-related protein